MSFTTLSVAARLSHALSAVALGLALSACGGGDGSEADRVVGAAEPAQAQAVHVSTPATTGQRATAARSVTVKGCVLDRFYVPTTDTPVRALAADGRLLGSARSDGQGHFTLNLPPHTPVLLQIDRPDGESLPLHTGAVPATPPNCLLDQQA